MPVLNLNEDEQKLLVTALLYHRVRLMHEWERIGYDDGRIDPNGDRWVIDGVVDAITDLRRKIETAQDISKSPWHNEYGWLHSKKDIEAANDAVEAGEITRKEGAAAVGVDLAEVDPDNARDRAPQDQIAPGTWETLPEGFDVDADRFEITDPAEPKVKRIEIKIDGVTRTVYSTDRSIEELERALVDLQTAQRAYLDGCVSEMVS